MMTASCTLIIVSESCYIATWLCDARECSMISAIVKLLSAPTSAQPRTMTRDILGGGAGQAHGEARDDVDMGGSAEERRRPQKRWNTHISTPSRSGLLQRPCVQHTMNIALYSQRTRPSEVGQVLQQTRKQNTSISSMRTGLWSQDQKCNCKGYTSKQHRTTKNLSFSTGNIYWRSMKLQFKGHTMHQYKLSNKRGRPACVFGVSLSS